MASIHKRARSPYWWGAWRDSTGRLYYRSTKQTDKHKAKAFALECERAEKHATAGTLTEAQARDILADIMERTETGDTLTQSQGRRLAARMGQRQGNVESRDNRHPLPAGTIEEFLKYMGARANRPLVAITPRDIQGFVDLRAKTVGPSTVNVDGKILRAALTRARKLGLILSNPAEAVELPARQSMERGTFTGAEIKMLVDAAKGEWKTLILLGYYTGARLSECCRVEWKDTDLAAGTICFPITKTGKNHILPLHTELAKHLERIAGDTPGPIMPHLAGVRVSGRRGLSKHFLDVMAKAGLDAEKVDGKGERQMHRRTFHALRHSFTSALANAGVSPELRMKLTGHKSAAVHQGYTHHELQTLKAALAKLPKAAK